MTIFTDLQNAIAPFVGGSVAAGALLFIAVTGTMFIAFSWIFRKDSGLDMGTFLFAAGIGIVFSTVVGWLDPWAVVFIALILVFVILKPFGSALGG